MPVHTQANTSAKKMTAGMGTGAIGGRLLPRASTACSEAVGKQGLELVNRRGAGRLGAFRHHQPGCQLFACRLLALLHIKGSLQPHEELHVCAPAAAWGTHTIGMLLAEARNILKV